MKTIIKYCLCSGMALFLSGVNPLTANKLRAGESKMPPTMTKMVIRDISHFIPKGSYLSKPKTLYRSGLQLSRLELPLDPEKKVQWLMVVHEPDIWTINRADKTGQHMKDPEGESHFPIWAGAEVPEPLKGLEFGMEFEFLDKYKGVSNGPASLAGISCDRYTLKRGNYQVVLFAKKGTRIPVEIRVLEDSKPMMDDFYDSYEPGLPFDASLFRVPRGVKITEAPVEEDSEWREFKPEKARCTVLLPGNPEKTDPEMERWESNDAQNRSYSLYYSDLKNPIADPDVFFKEIVKGGAESSQSKVLSQRRFNYKGFPTCEFKASSENEEVAWTRIYLVHQRLYVLIFSEKLDHIVLDGEKSAKKFFDSLAFIAPELNRGK